MKRNEVNILVACEESQAECLAFRERGFNAFSCDVQLCKYGGRIDWHIPADVTPLLEGRTTFRTQDDKKHRVSRWHLIIAHPPCTYLCKVSSVQLKQNGEVNQERWTKMMQAKEFFEKCLNANADFVAVENPLPMAAAGLPKPSCFIQPYWYGVPYSKKTLYWLRNLPPLMAVHSASQVKQFVRSSRGKYRSRTFPEVTNAIADQWGDYLCVQLNVKK